MEIPPKVADLPEPNQGKTRILVADDHPLLRMALAMTIRRQTDYYCCGETQNAIETLQAVALHRPHLVLLDLMMGNCDGLALIKDIILQHPPVYILVVSQLDEMLYAERALRAGARGYVMKERPAKEILQAISSVLAGEIYVSPKVASQAVNSLAGHKHQNGNPTVESLTNRELQVFRLLGEGKNTKAIADELHVSFKTIESHRENIKHKLGLFDAVALIRHAASFANGLKLTEMTENLNHSATAAGPNTENPAQLAIHFDDTIVTNSSSKTNKLGQGRNGTGAGTRNLA
jgi:DNA-binding NarL/FixJ family response regulator